MSEIARDKNLFFPRKIRVFSYVERENKKAIVAREGAGCEANLKKIENDGWNEAPLPWESRDNVPTTGWKLFGQEVSGGNFPSGILTLKGPDNLVYRSYSRHLLNSIIKFGILPGGELPFPLMFGYQNGELVLESVNDPRWMDIYMTEDEREKIIKREQKEHRKKLKEHRAGDIPPIGSRVKFTNSYEHFIYIGKVTDGKNKWHAFVDTNEKIVFNKTRDGFLRSYSSDANHQLRFGQLYKDFPIFEEYNALSIHESLNNNDVAQIMFEICESWHIRNENIAKWSLGERTRSYSYNSPLLDFRVWHILDKKNKRKYNKNTINSTTDVPLMMHPLTLIIENHDNGACEKD